MIPSRPADDFGLRLAVLFACVFVVIGIQFPFFPLWLKARGLDSDAIGFVLAIPIGIRIFAVSAIGRAADRIGDLRIALTGASFAAAAGFVLVGFSNSLPAIALAVAIASLAAAPVISLADAYALKGLNTRGRPYGPVRLWGSIAFVAANLGTGYVLGYIPAAHLIWLIVAAFLVLGLCTLSLPRLEQTAHAASDIGSHLWRSPKFLSVAVAASLIQASHALYYGFSAVDWTSKGLSSTTVGVLWAIGVVAEIILFACSGRLALNPVMLVAIGAAGALIRWLVMVFNPSIAVLPAVQCLHGLSFGATHLGAVQLVARLAGTRTAAAQGDLAMLLAIANAAATGTSGLLYGAMGDYGYAVMAAMAALGGAGLVLAWPMHAKQ